MPPTGSETEARTGGINAPPGQRLAVAAEGVYLANLLVLPGFAFVVLLWLYAKHIRSAPKLAVCHLRQTMNASLWAFFLLAFISAEVIYLGGGDAPYTWVVVILYFLIVHTALVVFGIFGLARALAGKHCHYPLVGTRCNERSP